MSRMAAAAVEAAFEDGEQPQRRRHSGLRALAAGAALAAAARLVVAKAPDIPRLSELSQVPDAVRDRLAEHGWLGDQKPEDEDYLDEEYLDEEEDEPEAEEEVEPEAEEEVEP